MIPNSCCEVLYLLAACQKYDMFSVQSFIRAEVGRGPSPVPRGANTFSAYAIASAKRLIPEMEYAARLTLDHPMTFEILGEGLRLFEGWALRDLVDFRRRCRDSLVTCLDRFIHIAGPSHIWVGCPDVMPPNIQRGRYPVKQNRVLPKWLNQLLSQSQNDLKLQKFTDPLDLHSRIREGYLEALKTHLQCNFCLGVHATKGSTFCAELEDQLTQETR